MSHCRQQIAIAAASRVSVATTGLDVTLFQLTQFGDDQIPGCNVVWDEDSLEDTQYGGSPSAEIWVRQGALALEIREKVGNNTIFDALNNWAVFIEPEMTIAGMALQGVVVQDIQLASSSFELFGEADKDSGMLRMVYTVRYKYSSSDPQTLLQ